MPLVALLGVYDKDLRSRWLSRFSDERKFCAVFFFAVGRRTFSSVLKANISRTLGP